MSKKIDVLSLKGEKVKDIKLEDNIFNIEPNDAVIKDAVVAAMAGARQGTAKVKTRSEVAGGGRKPDRHVHRPRRPVHVPLLQGRSGSRPPYALRGL